MNQQELDSVASGQEQIKYTDQYTFKIIMLGSRGVGKSNILLKYTKNKFDPSLNPTIGIEFAKKRFIIPKTNHSISLQIWDTAGSETFKSVTRAYYKSAVGALLVFDISDRQSFLDVDSWLKDLQDNTTCNILKLLVGNKADKEEKRQVTKDEAIEYAQKNQIGYIETSALNGQNIQKTFYTLSTQIYKLIKEEEEFLKNLQKEAVDGKSQPPNQNPSLLQQCLIQNQMEGMGTSEDKAQTTLKVQDQKKQQPPAQNCC